MPTDLKVDYEVATELVEKCRTDLEELDEAIQTIDKVIDTVYEQKSPKTIGSLSELLTDLKSELKNFSEGNISETIDMIKEGIDSFEETDTTGATEIKNSGDEK